MTTRPTPATLDSANAFVSPGVNSRGELVPSHGASRRRLGDKNNCKASHLSDILSDIESNISPQNRCRAINFTSPNSMSIPLSKDHRLFTIWAIPATHDKLCLSKIQFSTKAFTTDMIVGTKAAEQPDLLVRKHSASGGGDLHWNERLSKQHHKKTRYK